MDKLMSIPDYLPIYYWIEEREAIRKAKECHDLFPWSKDPIFQKYRFCNVRREDDRVTIWIRKNIRERFDGHQDLWFMLCIARQINWPDTLWELISSISSWPGYPGFSPVRMGNALQERAKRGEKVFTGAYNITAPPTKGAYKTHFVAEQTLGNLWRNRKELAPHFHNRLHEAHEALMTYKGWGPFMAYQAVVDMRFCPTLLAEAGDRFSWAAAGPGTIRGLNRIYKRPIDAPLGQIQAREEMLILFHNLRNNIKVEMDFSDVPNILCETDKYLRIKNGEGRTRANYIPGRGW